jgi:hypothetical protein
VGSSDSTCIHTKLMERMRGLIECKNEDEGVSVL